MVSHNLSKVKRAVDDAKALIGEGDALASSGRRHEALERYDRVSERSADLDDLEQCRVVARALAKRAAMLTPLGRTSDTCRGWRRGRCWPSLRVGAGRRIRGQPVRNRRRRKKPILTAA